MTICTVCGGNDFNIHGGLYFCRECGIQSQDVREEEHDDEHEAILSGAEISSKKNRQRKQKHSSVVRKWLSNEAYNIVLHCQVNALINLGASPSLKSTVLQLWASYLQASEFCFKYIDTDDDWIPALGASWPRDIQLLKGEILRSCIKKKRKKRKKIKKRLRKKAEIVNVEPIPEGNTVTQDEASDCSTDDQWSSISKKCFSHCKKQLAYKHLFYKKRHHLDVNITDRQIKALPQYMTLAKTLSFCYLGLLIVEDLLLLGDLLRFAQEGKIPYMDAVNCLPDDMKLQYLDRNMLSSSVPSMVDVIKTSTKIAKFIKLPILKHRPVLPIIAVYLKSLHLPTSLLSYTTYFLSNSTSLISDTWYPTNEIGKIFSYEIKAMACILISLKFLFVLDDKAEIKHSSLVRQINSILSSDLFVWDDWFNMVKLHSEFLKTRYITSLKLFDILDVNVLTSHYDKVVKNWGMRETSNVKLKSKTSHFRSSLRRALSGFVPAMPDADVDIPPSSFPMILKIRKDIHKLRMSEQLSSSMVDLFLQDFSQCSVFFNDVSPSLSKSARQLIRKLNRKFYGNAEESEHDLLSFWHISATLKTAAKVCQTLPNNFTWLLEFASQIVGCRSCDLYYCIVTMEKEIFKFKLNKSN